MVQGRPQPDHPTALLQESLTHPTGEHQYFAPQLEMTRRPRVTATGLQTYTKGKQEEEENLSHDKLLREREKVTFTKERGGVSREHSEDKKEQSALSLMVLLPLPEPRRLSDSDVTVLCLLVAVTLPAQGRVCPAH